MGKKWTIRKTDKGHNPIPLIPSTCVEYVQITIFFGE